jgi:nitrate/TMAO reductase-like tetraheme cytochrome c subunit/mono/diheme cytochrome c family protein
MRNLLQKLRLFFFPPPGTTPWQRVLPYAILGILTIAVLVGGNYAWEHTNSSEFCGTACHTMPPEYSAYLISPHARVQCVECHIGRDAFTETFTRKAGDLRHVVMNVTKAYEFPIKAEKMRPASDSCETCHFPEKFSDDSLRHMRNYRFDETNTPQDIYLIMKTGGGAAREGLGFGIHWHIENQVLYYSTDEHDQEIPYVRVVDAEGNSTEYIDISADFGSEDVIEEELVEMDCITCHNRITHEVSQPEDAVSQAIRKGLLVGDLPFLVEQSILLLRGDYPDKASALTTMESLETYYQENYPDVYSKRGDDISQAVSILQDIFTQSVYPEQKSDWDTHPNNMGHKISPGCFRCHDGKHLTEENEAIRLECNICHSIPVVGDPTSLTTEIELVSGPEPESHTLTNWMTLHGKAKDNTCTACHTTPEGYENLADLVGKPPPDNSFCGNEACHANVWEHTGFNSPEMEAILEAQLEFLSESTPFLLEDKPRNFEEIFGALFEGRCASCHSGDDPMAGLDVATYEGVLTGGSGGPGVVPDDPDASMIYQRQSASDDHYGQLMADELDALREWILAGAPEN